jgi:glycosyltransferase involved in cell wall biosynthesis
MTAQPGGGRMIFDLSSAARWTGPPVGIVRSQRELASWARRQRPDTVFAIFDPATMRYRRVADRYLDAFIAGEASLNAWATPDATGARVRRSQAVPTPVYAALQTRRTALRLLERVRLAEGRPGRSRLADRVQRALITRRYATAMLNPDGSRRAFLTADMAFAEPIAFAANDLLVCAGFGWSHSNIAAIAAAKAAAGFRLAVMCYDLIPLLFPEFFKPRDVADMRRYWDGMLRIADVIVANAHAVADDLREYTGAQGIEPGEILVRPLGATPATMRSDASQSLPDGLAPDRYALFVSTIEPRKGHELLYRVWLSLLEAGVPQRHDFKLVFVGRAGWMTEALDEALKTDARLAGTLVVLDKVSDAALDGLYRNAAFCVYPSLYEGYGLPVVEAFARGKAVIASTGGSLAEVAAGFSPALDPRDEATWRETLQRWIEDSAARAPYEAAIRERFRHPTWDEASAGFFEAIAPGDILL